MLRRKFLACVAVLAAPAALLSRKCLASPPQPHTYQPDLGMVSLRLNDLSGDEGCHVQVWDAKSEKWVQFYAYDGNLTSRVFNVPLAGGDTQAGLAKWNATSNRWEKCC